MIFYLRLTDKINAAVRKLLGILLTVMCLVIIVQVVCRGMKMSLPWSEEFARYVMIYIVFLGTGYAVRFDLLMSVKIVWEKVPQGGKRFLSLLVNGLMGIYFIVIFKYGIELLNTVGSQTSPAMQLPMSVPYGALPVGSALMLFNCVAVIIEDIAGKDVPGKDVPREDVTGKDVPGKDIPGEGIPGDEVPGNENRREEA